MPNSIKPHSSQTDSVLITVCLLIIQSIGLNHLPWIYGNKYINRKLCVFWRIAENVTRLSLELHQFINESVFHKDIKISLTNATILKFQHLHQLCYSSVCFKFTVISSCRDPYVRCWQIYFLFYVSPKLALPHKSQSKCCQTLENTCTTQTKPAVIKIILISVWRQWHTKTCIYNSNNSIIFGSHSWRNSLIHSSPALNLQVFSG